MWQVYYSPTNIEDAVRLLAEHAPDARIIAGGTDLMVELERGTREADVLIDVTRIGGLNQVSVDEGVVHVGPTVTHNQAIGSERV